MKQYKNINAKPNILVDDVTSKILLIGLGGFRFSKRISGKYTIFRKSSHLPVLVFLGLFGTRVVNKITNINRIESINNYIRLHFNNYFKMVSQIGLTLSHYYSKHSRITTAQRSNKDFIPKKLVPRIKCGAGFSGSEQEAGFQTQSPVSITRQALRYLSPQALSREQGDKEILDSRSPITPLEDKFHGNGGLEYFQFKSGNSFPNVIARSGAPKQSNLSVRMPIFWRAMTGMGTEKEDVDGLFGRQNKNILRAKITDKYLQFAEMKMNTRKANASTLKNYTDLLPDMIYPVRGNIYQDSRAIEQEKTLSGLKNSINNINNKTTELILRKPVAQSSNSASENKEDLRAEKTISTKINDNLIKDSFKEGTVPEINMIADKVYKIIEKRISVEKERRGWR